MKRLEKFLLALLVVVTATGVAVMLLLPATPRKGTSAGAPPRSRPVRHSTSWDWRKEWQEAPRGERVKIARRMVSEEVLVGLSSEEVLSALAPPRELYWYVHRSPGAHGYVTLMLFFDESGRLEHCYRYRP